MVLCKYSSFNSVVTVIVSGKILTLINKQYVLFALHLSWIKTQERTIRTATNAFSLEFSGIVTQIFYLEVLEEQKET